MQEDERLFEFLNGLDEVYNLQRSNMLMRTPLPTVDEAYCMIQQEESQREMLKPVKEEQDIVDVYKGNKGTMYNVWEAWPCEG